MGCSVSNLVGNHDDIISCDEAKVTCDVCIDLGSIRKQHSDVKKYNLDDAYKSLKHICNEMQLVFQLRLSSCP